MRERVEDAESELEAESAWRIELQGRVVKLEEEVAAERARRLHWEGVAHERAALIAQLRGRPPPQGWIG